jgi:hypothetical protein
MLGDRLDIHSMRGEESWKIGVRAHPIQTSWYLLSVLVGSIEFGLDPQGYGSTDGSGPSLGLA